MATRAQTAQDASRRAAPIYESICLDAYQSPHTHTQAEPGPSQASDEAFALRADVLFQSTHLCLNVAASNASQFRVKELESSTLPRG